MDVSPTNGRRIDAPTGRALLLAVVAAGALALVAGPAAAEETVTTGNETTVPPEMVVSQPAPPEGDPLGWENGVWYNATLAVDQSDGVNATELRALVARTMARVEHIRGLEFERTPPVRVITRAQQQNESSRLANVTDTREAALNAQYEALLLIDEPTDAVESLEGLLGGGVGGYYRPTTGSVTMVSVTDDALRVHEPTLSQELFHAQQDRKFDLASTHETTERRNAVNSVVEGDANYVQYLYEKRCGGVWNGTCYLPERPARNRTALLQNVNIGMVQIFLQPYSSGVAFVRDHYRSGGWAAVNDLYRTFPASTEQVIHPAKYREDAPTNLTVEDNSTDGWHPLRSDGERLSGSVGEAGLFVALWHPAYESRGLTQIIPLRAHYNINQSTGRIQRPVMYTYDHPVTAGWDGDRLVPYVADGSNATGYVYETAWDSAEDARAFADAYRRLLRVHGAGTVSGRADTYRIPSGGFEDAFYVVRNGTRVTIVNAPTVEELSGIRPGAAPIVETPTDDGTPMPGETQTETTTGESSAADGTSGPGFGLVVAALALVALGLVATRRG